MRSESISICKKCFCLQDHGHRITCERGCGKTVEHVTYRIKWVYLDDEEDGEDGSFVCEVYSRLKDFGKRKRAVWFIRKGEMYIRCHLCGSLNRFDKDEVSPGGFTRLRDEDDGRCFSCRTCNMDFVPFFSGWNSRKRKRRRKS